MSDLQVRIIPEFDPGGKKAAARAKAEREALLRAAVEAPVEAPAAPARVEAPVVEAPVVEAPAAPARAAFVELRPLRVPAHTIDGLRQLAHEALVVADSALDEPDGAELLALARQIQSVLARAVAGHRAAAAAPADTVEAPAAPAAPAAPGSVEAPDAPAAPAAPGSVEAPVEAPADPTPAPADAPARRR